MGAKAGNIGYAAGVVPTLVAGQETHTVYALEGHVVDRNTAQNGRGWAEGYAHTLNATDRHAVAIDCYNQVLTGEKTMPLRAAASDADHVGAVMYMPAGYGDMQEGCGALRANVGGVSGGNQNIVVSGGEER